MYAVSDDFLTAIESNSRNYFWTGTITTTGGTEYGFTNEDIVNGSGYITRSCCGSREIELGSVYAAELGISLYTTVDRYSLDEAVVKLYFHLQYEDGTEEVVPMGVFEVSEANRNIKTIEITAYDYMLRFDKDLNIEASSGTAYNFLTVICNSCKVELAQTQAEFNALPNGNETLAIYSDNDIETYRDLLYYVAQVLGCVCQIDRFGKLVLIPYGNAAVRTVEQKHRYSSTYSDFVTRYTAISSTNMITETAEYYALETDDGLTMNLETNPLLQFGLQTTRARLLNRILDAISVVEYVPFDSDTIGNPTLDPMDCLVFRGGHADETKISCITSIPYKINGKHSLKCVGKNPKLAEAKSKNDKNITGLLNQIEDSKTVVYDFVNASPFEIGNSATEVLNITFVSKEFTSAMFLAEMLLTVTTSECVETTQGTVTYEDESTANVTYTFTGKAHPDIEVIYKINDEEVDTFYPIQVTHEGKQILTLFFPLSSVEENSENTFAVSLKCTNGTLTIGEQQIRATISGQGLVAGLGDWNGRVSITETISDVEIAESSFGYDGLGDALTVTFPKLYIPNVTQVFSSIPILTSTFTVDAVNERITAEEVIKTFTMDKVHFGEYDESEIEVTEDGAFELIHTYSYTSVSEEIDVGYLAHLAIDTTDFEEVQEITVSLSESEEATDSTDEETEENSAERYLLKSGEQYYTIADGELHEVDIDTLCAEDFAAYGFTDIPASEYLLTLESPEVLYWTDSDAGKILTALCTAYHYPSYITSRIDMSHESILGISLMTAQYSSDVMIQYSLDDGVSFTDEISFYDFLNIDTDWLYESLPKDKLLVVRFVLHTDATLTSFIITYEN